jgi:endonuclease/exonuclease/phosphatase family metal-dependent hydrolase
LPVLKNEKFRKLISRSFIAFNILIILLYLLVCLVPFLESGSFWFIAMLGLIFPFLFILVFLLLLYWLIRRRWKWALVPAVALLLSWQQLTVCFAFRIDNDDKSMMNTKPDGSIRVLSWNVARWDEANREARGGQSYRNLMMDWVQTMDADIVCLQEFFECYDPNISVQNIPVIKKMGYPYHYFFPSSKIFEGNFQFGLCIFSKYPIIDSAQYLNGAGEHSEGFSYADIQVNDQVIRVFTTHLESFGFSRKDYEGLGTIASSGNILRKIKNSYELRNQQASTLRAYIDTSPYPVIVCGDVDDVPNSFAYFKVRGRLKDAFLERGAGMGGTYQFFSPTLRIDHLFTDPKFRVRQFSRQKLIYSDHYPILADIELIKVN